MGNVSAHAYLLCFVYICLLQSFDHWSVFLFLSTTKPTKAFSFAVVRSSLSLILSLVSCLNPYQHHPSAMRVLSRTFFGWWFSFGKINIFLSLNDRRFLFHQQPYSPSLITGASTLWNILWLMITHGKIIIFHLSTLDSCSIDDDFHYPSPSAMRVFSRTFLCWEQSIEWVFFFPRRSLRIWLFTLRPSIPVPSATVFPITHYRCKYSTTFDSCSIDDDFHYP